MCTENIKAFITSSAENLSDFRFHLKCQNVWCFQAYEREWMPGYFRSIREWRNTRWCVHVGPRRPCRQTRQVLIDEDKAFGYRTGALLHHAAPRDGRWRSVMGAGEPRLSKSNYWWLSLNAINRIDSGAIVTAAAATMVFYIPITAPCTNRYPIFSSPPSRILSSAACDNSPTLR